MSVEFCVSLGMLNILTYYFIACKYLKYATNFELYSDAICFQIYWEPQQVKAARTSLDLTRRHPLSVSVVQPRPEERIGIWNRLMRDVGHGTGFQWEQREGFIQPIQGWPSVLWAPEISIAAAKYPVFLVRLEIHRCR